MHFRYLQVLHGIAHKVKFDEYGWLLTYYPAIMARLNRHYLRRNKVFGIAIGVLNLQMAVREKSGVLSSTR